MERFAAQRLLMVENDSDLRTTDVRVKQDWL